MLDDGSCTVDALHANRGEGGHHRQRNAQALLEHVEVLAGFGLTCILYLLD